MYKRRIVLGGAAPAAVLALGIFAAGPAMAATSTSAIPGSLLSQLPGLSGAASMVQGVASNVPAVSSLSGVSGTSTTGGASNLAENVADPTGIQSVTGQLPNASAVTNALGTQGLTSGLSNDASSATGQSSTQDPSSDSSGLGGLGSATDLLGGLGGLGGTASSLTSGGPLGSLGSLG